MQITSSMSLTVPLPSHRAPCLCFPSKFARERLLGSKCTKKRRTCLLSCLSICLEYPPPFPPWYIKYLPSLSESWESICSAKRSICNDSESSDVLPIFQQRAPLNPFPWVGNTAHVPRVGMLADRRRAGLADSIHLVFPFQQNAFPHPRKEAAAFGKHVSVTCLLPETFILGSWKEKNNPISTLLRELQSVHLEKIQDGREGFESFSVTAEDRICVKQIRERAPVTKKELMPNFPFSTMLSEGLSFANVTGKSEDRGEGRGFNLKAGSFSEDMCAALLTFTLLYHVWIHIMQCRNKYMYVCIYVYTHMYKCMCISCFYKLWLLHLLYMLFCLRHFKSPGFIVFHVWFIEELIQAGLGALTACTLDRPLFLSLFISCTALGLRQVAIAYKWPSVKLH